MREELAGGVNRVTRIDDTVRRPTGPWTPAVHALLVRLATAGFDGAPRVHGIDPAGREILDFIAGDVSEDEVTDDALPEVAMMLRRYHDATVGWSPPPDARWYLPPQHPAEVICHGDIAPYNCVRRDGYPVAFIDFDTAHPGPRRWDVAYAAYRFVPLSDGRPWARQAARLRRFCDAYGLDGPDRRLLASTVVRRLESMVEHIHTRAAAGDEAFRRHLDEGHPDLYRADIRHVTAHADDIAAVLAR